MYSAGMKQLNRFSVINIDGNDLSTGTSIGRGIYGWTPGNPLADAPSVYGFFLFEQDKFLDTHVTNPQPYTLKEQLVRLGLQSGKLVGLTWFKLYGNIFTRLLLQGSVPPEMLTSSEDAKNIPLCFPHASPCSAKGCTRPGDRAQEHA